MWKWLFWTMFAVPLMAQNTFISKNPLNCTKASEPKCPETERESLQYCDYWPRPSAHCNISAIEPDTSNLGATNDDNAADEVIELCDKGGNEYYVKLNGELCLYPVSSDANNLVNPTSIQETLVVGTSNESDPNSESTAEPDSNETGITGVMSKKGRHCDETLMPLNETVRPSLKQKTYIIHFGKNTRKGISTHPRLLKNLKVSNVSSEDFELSWDKPLGKRSCVWIHHDNEIVPGYATYDITNKCHVDIKGLKPSTNYEVYVHKHIDSITVLVKEVIESELDSNVSCSLTTKEAKPPKVHDVNAEVTFNKLILKWNFTQSEYISEEIVFEVYLSLSQDHQIFTREQQYTFGGLAAGAQEYVIRAHNCDEVRGTAVLPVGAPPKDFVSIVVVAMSTTSVTIAVHKTENADKNGTIHQFSVIVEEMNDATKLYEIRVPLNIYFGKRTWNFTIGDARDSCTEEASGSCNRALRPSTGYYIQLRANTTRHFCQYSIKRQVNTLVDNTVLVATLAALCVAATVAWVALLWWSGAGAYLWKRDTCAGAAYAARWRPTLTSHPVRLAHFPNYVRCILEDPESFREEFAELSMVGRKQACTAAELPCNRPKNRFTDILPYDHSRFKLQPVDDEEGSDYINANYVPGFISTRDFIAAQGPTVSTRNAFWRMCWEGGASAIVMLTLCVEKGADKCDHYWPRDERPVRYGALLVAVLESSHYSNWTVTELQVSKGEERRILKHFQYNTWPDFGVPEPRSALLQFVRAFRELVPPASRPVVVHCSAGVGRSGSFICLDRVLLQLASGAEEVDVAGVVHAMRLARTNMVQTEEQYAFVHVCIATVIEAIEVCKRRSTMAARGVPARPAPPPPPPAPAPAHTRASAPPPAPAHERVSAPAHGRASLPCSSMHVHYNVAFEDDEVNIATDCTGTTELVSNCNVIVDDITI